MSRQARHPVLHGEWDMAADAGGEPLPNARRGITLRHKAIVDAYQSSRSLKETGTKVGLSAERVRQIIARYERLTGNQIERHKRRGIGRPRVRRVLWTCRGCGVKREIRATQQETAPVMCRRCKDRQKIPTAEVIEGWIEQCRNGVRVIDIARNAGYTRQLSYYPIRYIAYYLRDLGRLRELVELQRGRSLRCLASRMPDLAKLLAEARRR